MDDDKKRIIDFFDAWELVEFLQLKTEDIVERFEEEIEEAMDDLDEFMGVRENGSLRQRPLRD